MMASTHVNPSLDKIYNQVKPKIRPTPKLTGKQITAIYVDEAAKLLAKEIDAEVIKQWNGGNVTMRENDVRKAVESLMKTNEN
jgi:hypothetical protein